MTDEPIRRALAIFPHPDDPEFAAGGTVARWTAEGIAVVYCILTDGSKGSDDLTISSEELVATRQREQREAAALLGVQTVEFLGYEDGGLEPTLALRREVVRAIRRHRPDRVVCFDPTARWHGESYINHPDHIASGEAVLAALYPAARNARTFPELLAEGLQPHTVRELWMAAPRQPNRWVDISATIERKIAATLAHRSQIRNPDELAGMLREWGRSSGAPQSMEFAEAFTVLNTTGG